jgi:hypothetical protein
MTYTADDALKMLEALPRDAPIECDLAGKELFFDHPTYTLPGGWKINVFIDCHDWDYIEYIIAPDGTTLDSDMPSCRVPSRLDPDQTDWHPVFFWSPDEDDKRWGLLEPTQRHGEEP